MVSQKVNDTVSAKYATWHGATDPAEMLRGYDAMLPAVLDGYEATEDKVAGVPGLWLKKPGRDTGRVIVYLHGGGFFAGTAQGYAGLASRIAEEADADVYLVDFSLAPFPQPFDETLAVYRELSSTKRIDPALTVIAGDSAGGGLGLAILVALRDAGEPLPAAFVAMSPWSDLTHSGDSFDSPEGIDPVLTRPIANQSASMYLGDADPTDIRASAYFADLHDLPPTLIQVGTSEALLSDSLRLAEKLRGADVNVDLQVAYEMPHVYQMFVDDFPQASESLSEAGRFVARTFAS